MPGIVPPATPGAPARGGCVTAATEAGGRLSNIQALRAIAVLLVMAIHIHFNEQRASSDPLLPGWFYHGVSGVDLFFVISGFIMVWITRGSHGSAPAVGGFLFSRAARIYPPVWLFTTLAIAGFVVAGTLQEWTKDHSILFSYLLFPHEFPPVLGVSWTIIHELYFYLVFAVLLLLPARFLPFGLALWGAVVGLGEWLKWDAINPWTKLALHPLTFEFLAGAFVGLIATRWKPIAPAVFLAVGVAAFIAGAVWLGPRTVDTYPQGWGRVIAFGPGSALIVYGAAGLEIGRGLQAPRWLTLVGDCSYSLYLSHLLVIAGLAHFWMTFAAPGVWDNIGMIAAMIVTPLIVACVTYYGFEKPSVKLAHRLRDKWFTA
jgi:exopolysaccharide production protein ExoZ